MSNKSFLNFCHPLYLHLLYLTNGQWFWYLLDCTDNSIDHHINQNVVKSVGCTLWLCNILTTVYVVVDKSTDHAKPLSICFFYHNIEVILSDSLTAWLLCDMLTWAALSVLLLFSPPPPLQKPTFSKSQIIYLSCLREFILVIIVCS